MNTTTLCGRVETVFFASPGFSAGRLRTLGGYSASFAGALMVREHDPVVLHGQWQQHPKYGRQFKVKNFAFDQSMNPEGLAHYLTHHPNIKGIGPVKARKIVDAFGEEFDRIIDEEPERVAEAAKLSLEVVDKLRQEWLRTRTLNASLTWLASFELTHHQMNALIKKLGNSVVTVLKTDPYILMREMPGFGFKRVDIVARKLGFAKENPSRIAAGIVHCVAERLEQGNCWVDYEELIELANALLIMDVSDSRERIERALDTLIDQGQLVSPSISGRFLVAQPFVYEMELYLAKEFIKRKKPNHHFLDETDDELLDGFSSLNKAQQRALLAAARNNLVLISGGAGSGKTYTLAEIYRMYVMRSLKVMLAAPTGKAAKRIEQVVNDEAFTVHRMLGFNGEGFMRSANTPIDADVVIVDEVSMLDIPLAWHLFRAVDSTRTCLVLVGDHNQLPPVGPGNLLRDLIERRPVPTVILDEVVRQAGALKENSIALLSGKVRPSEPVGDDGRSPWVVFNRFSEVLHAQGFVRYLFDSLLVEQFGFDILNDVQLLTPTRKGPLGVDALNIELQRLIQKKLWGVDVAEPRPGRRPDFLLHDRVIQTRNDYDLGVMNGSIGVVTSVGRRRNELIVQFDDGEVKYSPDSSDTRNLSLAYALSFHKSQGSEFPCVVLLVHKAHSFMHHRNLFYTGVTRARQVAIIVGDPWGMQTCAAKQEVERRKTFLSVLEFYPETNGDTACN